ncbi:hypothetical protein I7331_36980 [Frankia sp. AgB1.8]|nr:MULTISPECIES: Chromate resistance protein ChrB [unclassified Frankia]MBL7624758.1 hypothetical protein [Frankia sp. AgB1.8]
MPPSRPHRDDEADWQAPHTDGGEWTATGTNSARWLLLIYRVRSEPTRLRVGLWRKLKGLGAIYLQNSAAALPVSATGERALRTLRKEITEMGGVAYLLSCDVLAGEAEVLAAFDAAATTNTKRSWTNATTSRTN